MGGSSPALFISYPSQRLGRAAKLVARLCRPPREPFWKIFSWPPGELPGVVDVDRVGAEGVGLVSLSCTLSRALFEAIKRPKGLATTQIILKPSLHQLHFASLRPLECSYLGVSGLHRPAGLRDSTERPCHLTANALRCMKWGLAGRYWHLALTLRSTFCSILFVPRPSGGIEGPAPPPSLALRPAKGLGARVPLLELVKEELREARDLTARQGHT